jgi:hypothetical protein
MEKCVSVAQRNYIFVDIKCTEFSKGRGAFIFVHAVQVYRGFRGVDAASLNIGAKIEWRGQRYVPTSLPF